MDVVPAGTFFLLLCFMKVYVVYKKRKRDDERKKREKRLNDRQLGAIGLNVHHKSLFLLYVDGAQFNQLLWYLLFLNIQKKKM
jgi:hypothetical protein